MATFKALLTLALIPIIVNAEVPTIEGYTLTWGDDFIGNFNSLPSTDNWIVDTGSGYPGGPANWGTGEIQTYTSSAENIKLDGSGVLSITALKDQSGSWTSSRIETQRKDFLAIKGGKLRIQARIAMPDVTGTEAIGYWPAFWTLGGDYRGNYQNWPSIGEFDIMENVNGINSVWGVVHCGVAPGGPCKESDGLPGNRSCIGSTCQGNMHVYAFEIDRTTTPESINWYVDDTKFHTITEETMDTETWSQAVHKGHFILLNLAIGGAFPNNYYGSATPLETTVSGKSLLVDYVAVYNSHGNGNAVARK